MFLLKNYRILLPLSQNLSKSEHSVFSDICRTLFCDASLGLGGYRDQREKSINEIGKNMDYFKDKLQSSVDDENKIIYADSFKSMIHVCQNVDNDLDFVLKMAKRFHNQDKRRMFTTYVFGPPLMRMYYHYQRPNEALKAMREIDGFFDQSTSYVLLMDLLYENGQYEEVVKLIDIVRSKTISGLRLPIQCFTLALAALYKINTVESLSECLKLLCISKELGHNMMMRPGLFASALALNQQEYNKVLDIVMEYKNSSMSDLINVKLMALAQLSKPEECVPTMRNYFDNSMDILRGSEKNRSLKYPLLKEAITAVEDSVNESNNSELISEFNIIKEKLERNNMISDQSLENFVSRPIEMSQSKHKWSSDPTIKPKSRREILEAAFSEGRNIRNSRNT